jgi:hypothetical protein
MVVQACTPYNCLLITFLKGLKCVPLRCYVVCPSSSLTPPTVTTMLESEGGPDLIKIRNVSK